MEGTLTARDKVGVQDFVLLDAYTSESAFLENLRKRFRENLIYVRTHSFPSCLYCPVRSPCALSDCATDIATKGQQRARSTRLGGDFTPCTACRRCSLSVQN